MTPELAQFASLLVALAVGWFARHKGLFSSAAPLPVDKPLVPASTKSTALNAVLNHLEVLAQQEANALIAGIAKRILPEPESPPVTPVPRS